MTLPYHRCGIRARLNLGAPLPFGRIRITGRRSSSNGASLVVSAVVICKRIGDCDILCAGDVYGGRVYDKPAGDASTPPPVHAFDADRDLGVERLGTPVLICGRPSCVGVERAGRGRDGVVCRIRSRAPVLGRRRDSWSCVVGRSGAGRATPCGFRRVRAVRCRCPPSDRDCAGHGGERWDRVGATVSGCCRGPSCRRSRLGHPWCRAGGSARDRRRQLASHCRAAGKPVEPCPVEPLVHDRGLLFLWTAIRVRRVRRRVSSSQ